MKELFEEFKNLETMPLKSLIDKMKNGYSGNQVLEETDYKVSRIETISDGTVNFKKVGFVEESDKLNEYKLEFGDLLFSNINSLAMVGKTAIFDFEQENLYAGMNLLMIRPKENVDSKWLYYVINSYYFNQLVKANAKHAINQVSIPTSKIKELPIAYVDYQKQIKIRTYLDAKTSLIDELVKAKEDIINKFSQQRQSIITEAVTRGLNPNVKMKDSGVNWIGKIPEHWEKSKVKYEVEINKNTLSEVTNPLYELEYIDIGSVDSTGKILKKELYTFENTPNRARRIIRKGDTLISTVRTYLKAITTIEYQQDNLICSTGFAVLTPKKRIHSKYLGYIFKSSTYVDEIVSRSKGVSYPAINASDIGDLELIFPSHDEQIEIIDYLESELWKIDHIINLDKIQIKKLKEYRQSLIYEAVTGKIDVSDMEID